MSPFKLPFKKRFLVEEIVPYLLSHNKKPIVQQIREMNLLKTYYHYKPYHYINYHMYLNSFNDDILDYIPPRILQSYRDKVNPREVIDKVENKIIFSKIMAAKKLPALSNLFIISRDREIRDMEAKLVEFDDFIEFLISSGNREIFVKPVTGIAGREAYKVILHHGSMMFNSENIIGKDSFYNRLFNQSKYKEFIVQKMFRQHALLDQINHASVNTIRIHTFVDKGHVLCNAAYLKASTGGECVDNWSKGGIEVRVDLESGILCANGRIPSRSKNSLYGVRSIQEHPVSGFRFQGTAIPFWDGVKKLVCSAALVLLPLRWLGWDVAIGKDGPVLVEANHNHDVFFMQTLVGGLRKTSIGREILQLPVTKELIATDAIK